MDYENILVPINITLQNERIWEYIITSGDNFTSEWGFATTTIINSNGTFIYFFGGKHNNICNNYVFKFWIEQGIWEWIETTGDLPPGLSSSASVLVDMNIYIFGGTGTNLGNSNNPNMYYFNIIKKEWKLLKITG